MHNKLLSNTKFHLTAVAVLALSAALPLPAAAVDWGGVNAKELILFYTGQGSWEWSLTQSDHSGNEKFREGKNCKDCHKGEEKKIGDKIVSGEKLEPKPIPGMAGSLPVKIQTTSDGDKLYVRFEWQSPKAAGKKMDPDTAVHVTMMLGNAAVKEATRAGCWGTCHDDSIGMASAPAGAEITKYLTASRTKVTRQGGGENYKSSADLQQLIDKGAFMEYWQAKLNPGKPAQAVSGYILDKRHQDSSPLVEASAEQKGGKWSVILSRKLKAGSKTHKDLVPGNTYHVGFAIHENHSHHRFHYVSLEYTLSLDQGTDFVAKQ